MVTENQLFSKNYVKSTYWVKSSGWTSLKWGYLGILIMRTSLLWRHLGVLIIRTSKCHFSEEDVLIIRTLGCPNNEDTQLSLLWGHLTVLIVRTPSCPHYGNTSQYTAFSAWKVSLCFNSLWPIGQKLVLDEYSADISAKYLLRRCPYNEDG